MTDQRPAPDPVDGDQAPPTPYELVPEPDPAPMPPTAPPPPSGSPRASIARPSLTEAPADEPCPKCGTRMQEDAVVCIACGYDLRTARSLRVDEGVEHAVDDAADLPPLVRRGRLSPQVLAGIGATLLIAAAVAAGVNSVGSGWHVAARVVLVLYNAALHTGTGLVAVALAAWATQHRFGRVDIGAARMFVAFAAFLLLVNLRLPVHPALGLVVVWAAALAAYWSLVLVLFRLPRTTVTTIAVAHFILWLLVELGMYLSVWSVTTSPPAPAAP